MTNEVKRYECYYVNDFNDEYPAFSRIIDNGEWCDYEDIQSIIKERDELQRENEKLKQYRSTKSSDYFLLEKENEKLREELKTAREDLYEQLMINRSRGKL